MSGLGALSRAPKIWGLPTSWGWEEQCGDYCQREAVSAQLVGFGAISKAGKVPYRKTSEWRMLEALEPGPSREEGTSWKGAAHWCWQGVRAEPAVLSGVFVPNLLTLPSCCTNVFVHWECGGKRGVFDASKVDNQTKNSADQGI